MVIPERAAGKHHRRTGPADYPHHAHHGGECINITFTPEPIPELTITVGQLAALGFNTDTPIRLVLRDNTLSVTTVID
ncbi:hypothetical protein WKG84_04190 [Pantoea agglomerans]|uniref:hypothetical protein n=1 Tax=Enterobacter agglomerans TaxID=549 RepID=UPI003C79BFC5